MLFPGNELAIAFLPSISIILISLSVLAFLFCKLILLRASIALVVEEMSSERAAISSGF